VKQSGVEHSRELTVTTGQLTDAEKKAKKKARKAAQKTQEDPKKAATSANEDKGLEAPAPKDDDPDGTKLLASPNGLEMAARLLQPLVNLELPSMQLWATVYDVAIRRSKSHSTSTTGVDSQKLQRDTCRQSKPFGMPPHLILWIQKYTYVW
jgi:hypothetical protein